MSILDAHCIPTNAIVTLTTADTEYSHEFAARTKGFDLYNRNSHATRYSWASGDVAAGNATTGVFKTLPAGASYSKDVVRLDDTHRTIYLASDNSGDVIEIEEWA